MGGRSKGMRKEGGKITIEGNGSVCEEGSERVDWGRDRLYTLGYSEEKSSIKTGLWEGSLKKWKCNKR